jgi:hypothetical protein
LYAVHITLSFCDKNRGFFPLQELCGALIAMNLARKEILGDNLSWLQIYGVPIVLNAWANFRGSRPIASPSTDKPWIELHVSNIECAQ